MAVKTEIFGKVNGQEVKRFTISSEKMEVRLVELGASIQGLKVKTKKGEWVETVLFHDTAELYAMNPGFWGAVCGRHANRIGNAEFSLHGTVYKLEKNEKENSLHSGRGGFHGKQFSGVEVDENTVSFHYFSLDGEQGFPGNMFVKVTYSITDKNGLLIEYTSTTDEDTVWNLTNHAYFNLAGKGDVLEHTLQVGADFYTPVDGSQLTTGEILKVEGTPFDLRKPEYLKNRIGEGANSLEKGFDHNFVLKVNENEPDATLHCPETGLTMEVYTTMPGVQVYTAAGLNGKLTSNGIPAPRFGGVCLETQYFPNSLAHAHFPQPIQQEGTLCVESTEYRFSMN